MQRTMIKISADENFVMLRTYSRKYGRSGRFYISRKELKDLNVKREVVGSDGYSYIRIWLHKNQKQEEILKFEITWLNGGCGDKLIGHLERLSLVYQDFLHCIEESIQSGGKDCCRLSLPEYYKPVIEFKSRHNLGEIAKRKNLRRKLGKFLNCHFQWPNAVRIRIVDDGYVPYSFFFREERAGGTGICGGIILHGQENMQKAYYGMHT